MQDIVGTWELVETRGETEEGEAIHPPYGPEPLGVVTFKASGRMAAVLVDSRDKIPADEGGREYHSYTGVYRYDGKELVTKVDGASDPTRMATDQVRQVEFDGELMTLRPPKDSYKGQARQRILTWRKIA